ncbi:hypothetical protein B0A48_14105 [Cryoendolithus antarcticus]|uniref:Uncharacterized protein n=1 Tax=Cryoendolithus antarcticus TaxID=1507870 RepID=A0A1V8SLS8_9PEZI|nr:hypothetical protein B0A48_14105 [Cryoendolithus antarcticus]
MNVGSLPGYYYDEEKKKYFKIQPDAAVPPNARYSKSNVKYEQDAVKKRKLDHQFRAKQAAQTIERSRILGDATYGGLLSRETGTAPGPGLCQASVDRIQVSHLTRQDVEVRIPSLFAIHPTFNGAYAALGFGANVALYGSPWNISGRLDYFWLQPRISPEPRDTDSWSFLRAQRIVSTSVWPAKDPEMMVLLTDHSRDNVYVEATQFHTAARISTINRDGDPLWQCVINPLNPVSMAIAATQGVTNLPCTEHDQGESLSGLAETRSVDWLDASTIAAGTGKTVLLWDTRNSDNKRDRFNHGAQITALQTVPRSGSTQLLVASNRRLSLYDTRFRPNKPGNALLSFSLLHETTTLTMSISSRGLVAAATKIGADNKVQLFSLRAGRELTALDLPGRRAAHVTQLAWREDDVGAEYLQACVGNKLVKWGWEDPTEEVEGADEYIAEMMRHGGR